MAYLSPAEQVEELYRRCQLLCVPCHRVKTHPDIDIPRTWRKPLRHQQERKVAASGACGQGGVPALCEYGALPGDLRWPDDPSCLEPVQGQGVRGCLFSGFHPGFPELELPAGCSPARAVLAVLDEDHKSQTVKAARREEVLQHRRWFKGIESQSLESYVRDIDDGHLRFLCVGCHRVHSRYVQGCAGMLVKEMEEGERVEEEREEEDQLVEEGNEKDEEEQQQGCEGGHEGGREGGTMMDMEHGEGEGIFKTLDLSMLIEALGHPDQDPTVLEDWRKAGKVFLPFMRRRMARKPVMDLS